MAQPVVNIGYDTGTGLPCVVGKVVTCVLSAGGGGGGSLSATASAAPTPVTAGVNKPLNIGLFSNLFTTLTDNSGNVIDMSGLGTTTDKSGTITTGGVAQTAIALNAPRKGWCIQNPPTATENLSVRVGGTASATTGTMLSPGQQACNQAALTDTAAISIFAATTGHVYTGFELQ